MNNRSINKLLFVLLIGVLALYITPNLYGQQFETKNGYTYQIPERSGGSYMLYEQTPPGFDMSAKDKSDQLSLNKMAKINTSFDGFNFDNNSTETGGWLFIPPDPIGAAGTDRLIAVVNVMIEARDKTGGLLWRDALKDFFSTVGAPGNLSTFTFDPKIVYDHYENRFVVVALEHTQTYYGDPSNESRILLAVSKTATPATATAADWYFHAINSKTNIGGSDCWADYPGFEVDEEAVYITTNMYTFLNLGGAYNGVRLWIVDKGVVGGFYAGGAAAVTMHNPYAGGGTATTTMPALVYGGGGAGGTIGTYMVSYSGLSDGTNEYVQVVRVNNPLGAVTFTRTYVNVGNIETFSIGMPDAPQLGTTILIETNDWRALDAVWRNNGLWLTTQIVPPAGPDAGQATAHWFKLNVSSATWPPTLADQGDIGGEDIASNVYTFFPSVAVNNAGNAYFGFSASSEAIHCGAYCAGRRSCDPAGTVQKSETVHAGLDWYYRVFSGTRNRWGDYSGAALDPTDDNTFWIFNEYAMLRGTPTSGQDGRWGTAWASASFDLDYGDAPDPNYPTLFTSDGARHVIDCSHYLGASVDADADGQQTATATGDDNDGNDDEDGVTFIGLPLIQFSTHTVQVVASASGYLNAWMDFNQDGDWDDSGEHIIVDQLLSAGTNNVNFSIPLIDDTPPDRVIGVISRFRFSTQQGLSYDGLAPDGEVEDYLVDVQIPVELTAFTATAADGVVVLEWKTQSETENYGYHVYRNLAAEGDYAKITDQIIGGAGSSAEAHTYTYTDRNVQNGKTYYYKLCDVDYNGNKHFHGPISVSVDASMVSKSFEGIPTEYSLEQSYPNPFNPETAITFSLKEAGHVSLKVYNVIGQVVRTLVAGEKAAGVYSLKWNGTDDYGNRLMSGVYYYTLQVNGFSDTKKLVLMK